MAGLLGVERTRLSELLGSLERADWDRPTPCPGWTVLGLCCHLPTTTAAAAARMASLSRERRRGTMPGVLPGPGGGRPIRSPGPRAAARRRRAAPPATSGVGSP